MSFAERCRGRRIGGRKSIPVCLERRAHLYPAQLHRPHPRLGHRRLAPQADLLLRLLAALRHDFAAWPHGQPPCLDHSPRVKASSAATSTDRFGPPPPPTSSFSSCGRYFPRRAPETSPSWSFSVRFWRHSAWLPRAASSLEPAPSSPASSWPPTDVWFHDLKAGFGLAP